jgi:hypothetical protein
MIGRDGNPTGPTIAAAPPGVTGLNGGEFIGFNPFFEASRKQNAFKAGANIEVTQQFSFGINGRVTDDKYNTDFGVQNGQSWSANLDGTYVYRENGTITAYATQQQRKRTMTNEQRSPVSATSPASATSLSIPGGASWTNDLKDSDTTLGLNVKQGGLANNKLELSGDVTYTYTKTLVNTTLNYQSADTTGRTCADPFYYTCVPLPAVTSSVFRFNLSGIYEVAKDTKLRLGYLFARLRSDDFYYNGLQTGFTPTSVLPTNQLAPNYAVNVFYASLLVNF